MGKFLDKHNDLSKNAFLSLVISIFLVEFGFESSSFAQNVFVGQNLDTIHYSIYGLAYNYNTFIYVISVMAATGTQTAIVAFLAKGNKKQAQATFFLSVIINVALTIAIIFIVHLFAENIAWLFGARDDAVSLLPETAAYLRIISISTPAFCLSMLLPQIAMLQGGQKYIYLYAVSMLLLTITGCMINF